MTDSAIFWNRLANRYSRQPIGDEAAYQEKLVRTRAHFTPDTEVLEMACGTGGTARQHAAYVKHVRAIDFSENMIAIAQQRQAEAGVTNVSFEVAGIDGLKAAEAYDVVMAMSILHLLPNWRAVIAQAAAMLRPGGLLVTSTTCLGRAHALRPVIAVAAPLGLLPKVQFFDADTLVGGMTAAGLTVEDRWRSNPKAAVFVIARKAGAGAHVV